MDGFSDEDTRKSSYSLPKASDEQKAAIRNFVDKNISIRAVAGSGKTTTILYIAKVFHTRKTLLLTYNAKLKLETREKVAQLGIENLEVHSIHSMCVKYLHPSCHTDAGIIAHAAKPMTAPHYDSVIIDESQDISALYFQVIKKILSPTTFICILGDARQSIYGFNGADSRFLTLCDKLYSNELSWSVNTLSTSYRITHQMADFVNRSLLCGGIIAAKAGARPKYIYADKFLSNVIAEVKCKLLTYKPDEIFILAPSVRGGAQSITTRLSNLISAAGVTLYIPVDSDRKLDDDILRGKLVFSSYHQAKGLERKCVIVLGFDASYFKYYNRDAPQDTCPNELYVACTRATEQLVLIHTANQAPLPFVQNIAATCDVSGIPSAPRPDANSDKIVRVTDLIRHISPAAIAQLMQLINIEILLPAGDRINIPTKSMQGRGFVEEVSDITGSAVPAYYQYLLNDKMDIYNELPTHIQRQLQWPTVSSPSALLEVANRYNSHRSGRTFKVNQITDYNWLTEDALGACVDRLIDALPPNAEMEIGFSLNINGKKIVGFADAYSEQLNTLWELKCVETLSDENILQLCVYSLMDMLLDNNNTYLLYNILTGETRKLTATRAILTQLVQYLLHIKYHTQAGMTDDEFLSQHVNDIINVVDIEQTMRDCTQCDLALPTCNKIQRAPIRKWRGVKTAKPNGINHRPNHTPIMEKRDAVAFTDD